MRVFRHPATCVEGGVIIRQFKKNGPAIFFQVCFYAFIIFGEVGTFSCANQERMRVLGINSGEIKKVVLC